MLIDHCDACIATGLVLFARLDDKLGLELLLCGHHADKYRVALFASNFVEVFDRRK